MPRSWRSESDNSVISLKSWHSNEPRRLAGLTIEETIEFEALDALPPFDDNGEVAWTFEGQPTNDRERRWLELYTKMLLELVPKAKGK
jgi:hypothetical protein